jgi:hypothetical protein
VAGDLNGVDRLQPAQIPSGLDRLSYKAGEIMQEISLANDSMQGLNRSDESGKAIERKAASGSTSLSPIYASLDRTRKMVARNWLDLVQQFVTEERVFHITNKSKTSQSEQVPVNQPQPDGSWLNDLTVGEYSISVTNTQSRDSFDLYQYDILMQMKREGAPVPWSEVVNSLTILENKDEIVDLLKTQEGANPPSEDETKRKELENRMLEAQAADKEASAQVKQAQAQKSMAQAQNEGQDNSGQIEMAKMQLDATFKERESQHKMDQAMQKAQLDGQVAMQKLQMETQLAREKLDFEQKKMQLELAFLQQKFTMELQKLKAGIESAQIQAETKAASANAAAEVGARQAHQQLLVSAAQSQQALEHSQAQHEQKLKMAKNQPKQQPTGETK